jgi:hypothetical protein
MPKFRATLQLHGKTATGIEVPAEVVEELAAGKKPAVRVTIAGYAYRSTLARRGERYLVGVSAENRAGAGVAAGEELEVEIELDTEPREVEVPADFRRALGKQGDARQFFEGLTYSQQKNFVTLVEQAKKAETRERRIDKFVGLLGEGRKQP